MNHILAFFDEDQTYGDRFKKYASTRANCPFTVYSFHNYKDLKDFSQDHPIELLVGSESRLSSKSCNYLSDTSDTKNLDSVAEQDSLYTIPAKSIIKLSESPLNTDNSIPKNISGNGNHEIYKYQSGENILREIMTVYGKTEESSHTQSGDNTSSLFVVYSPIGRSGKTTFAKSLTRTLNTDCSSLYITIEEVSDYDAASDDNMCPGTLSEAIYFYKENKLTKERLNDLIYSSDGIDHILPVRSPEDITTLTSSELRDFINHIRTISDKDVVILDTDSILSRVESILPQADRVFMPVTEEPKSGKKLNLLENYLSKTMAQDTLDNIIKLIVPDPSEFSITETDNMERCDPITGYTQAVIANYIYR